MKSWDLTTLGSTMLSLSTEPGASLLSSQRMRLGIAGAESNCAIALARLGTRVSWHSKIARNGLSERVVSEIRSHGVDVSSVLWTESGRQEQMWVEAGLGNNHTNVIYDRTGAAIDSLKTEEIVMEDLLDTTFFHATGITPALSEDCRDTVFETVRLARKAGVRVSFDVNYRAKLWEPARAREVLSKIIEGVDLLFVGAGDLAIIWERGGEPRDDLAWLQDRFGITNVVLTQGGKGASGLLGDSFHRSGAFQGEVVSPIGAGDAFAAGVVHALLGGNDEEALRHGCAMAALARESRDDYVLGGLKGLEARMDTEGVKKLSR
ncbi:MAG: 2-keto-3-deoxygluconate kinase [Verrucomicrobiaceae bacterium]|nr:2-keto-3-deoxygluconate kinase [Verrucomicrobiaceae bacterium]